MGVRLPPEYQEVEWIEATGSQYFFSDVPIQDGLTVDAVQTFNANDCYLFGGHSGKGLQISFNGNYIYMAQSSYAGYFYWSGVSLANRGNNYIYHVIQTMRNNYQVCLINGIQSVNDRQTSADTSAGENAAVFGQRTASGSVNQQYKGRVYSLKVSKDGAQLADYVPCYRKSDGEIGMFDLVLQKFYANEGTGVFLKGADVIDSISPWLVARRRVLMRDWNPNLFDMADLEQGSMTASGENQASNTQLRSKNYINVEAGQQYTLSAASIIGLILVKYFNVNEVKISETSWSSNPLTFTTPSGTDSIRFLLAKSNVTAITPADVDWVKLVRS